MKRERDYIIKKIKEEKDKIDSHNNELNNSDKNHETFFDTLINLIDSCNDK